MGKMIELRPATLSDLEILRHWDEQEHVMASDPNDDWDWENELRRQPAWREQLIAEWNGRPVGIVQIIDPAEEESHYWGDVPAGLRAIDIWLGDSNDLGKGYGTEIMRLAIGRCFDDPRVNAILLDPLESISGPNGFMKDWVFVF
jgi:aminoglycoside 6'-N-acetyltransferase